jgi:chromosome segregation ATPase
MSELELIQETLARAARLRRMQRGLSGLWIGLFLGAAAWLLVLGIYKLLPIPPVSLAWTGVLAMACPLTGFLLGAWRREPASVTARWVDLQEGLRERLSTAVELSRAEHGGAWRELIVSDAAQHAAQLQQRKLVRFTLPGVARWTVLILAVAFGLGFAPEYRSATFQQSKTDAARIEEVGRRIEQLARRELATRPPANPDVAQALEAATALGQEFQNATLTRGEALKGISSMQDRLRQRLDEFGDEPSLRRMRRAARSTASTPQTTAASSQKQMETLRKQLGSNPAEPEQMEQLQEQLDQMQQQARDLANQGGGSDAERAQMSQSLAALAAQAADLGISVPDLDAAIQALAANQADLFLQNLEAATHDLEKLKQAAQRMQQLQEQMQQLGRNLAEQLENGQANLAQQTLEKMIQQLQSAGLSSDALEKIMEEVSNAVDPAGAYRDVADHLKQAAREMNRGDKGAAAESLAAARKALEELMEQFGDAQSLMAAIEAMREASACIASGQKWGLCSNCNGSGCGMCKSGGVGPGGRPGSGVGTWADENEGWLYDGS